MQSSKKGGDSIMETRISGMEKKNPNCSGYQNKELKQQRCETTGINT